VSRLGADATAVCVVGAGSIGAAWAIVFARAGRTVRLYDVDPAFADAAPGVIESRLRELDGFGLLAEPVETILARVGVESSLADAVHGAVHVQECVVENVDVKRGLFAELDTIAAPDAVLASSSSMIAASRFAADLPGRERCLVVHPGNPPYLLPIAEVVPAPFTAEAVVTRTIDLLDAVGMVPVRVSGEPEGFVFNRLQGALLREAYCLVRDGVIAPVDLDRVVTAGMGRRWAVVGPFATVDLNTRGGIERHATLMGPAYARMGAERGQDDPWPPELVAAVAAALQERRPPDDWAENVALRDRALMTLERARRNDPETFDRLS
jgi:L-gulonate 3-dehydrogenase